MIHQNVSDAEQAERPVPSIYDSATVASLVTQRSVGHSLSQSSSQDPGAPAGAIPAGSPLLSSAFDRFRRSTLDSAAHWLRMVSDSGPGRNQFLFGPFRGPLWVIASLVDGAVTIPGGRVHPDIFCKVRPSWPYKANRRVDCACVETSDGREEQPVTSIMWGCGYRPA
jgi:hypothetical protein